VYALLRTAHVWTGWLCVVLLAMHAIGQYSPADGRRVLEGLSRPSDRSRALRWCAVGVLLAEVIVGLLLHVRYSPFTAGVRANLEVVLRDPTLRYWNVVHPALGVVVLAMCVWSVRPAQTDPVRAWVSAVAVLVLVLTALAVAT
jgi:hypothetical protein